MATEPTLAEIVRGAIDSHMLDVHVSMPGRVESYDRATTTAEVVPMIRRAILDTAGNVQHEELPKLPNVRVMFPQSSTFSMSWDLVKGDFVQLVFNSSANGNWRETGDIADPGDLARHGLSYPVAFPTVGPNASTIPTSSTATLLEVGSPSTHVQVGAGAAKFVSLSNKVDTFLEDIVGAISSAVPKVGGLDGGLQFKTQLLAALTSAGWGGGGTTLPSSTAATKLKSE